MRLSILLTLFSLNLYAGEVDHYLAWNRLPKDEADYLNKLFNAVIQSALDDINENRRDYSCEEAAGDILKYFGIALSTPLEKYLKNTNKIDKNPNDKTPVNMRYRRSIFRRELSNDKIDQLQDYSLELQIDEVVNVGGIYVGVDKLTHFTAAGYLYYKIYELASGQLESEEAALRMAISLAAYGEKNILGKFSSGVFSFADLESNYQGFQFATNLCGDGPVHLVRPEKRWELSEQFDLRDYVNPFWDESFNPSFYYEGQNLSLMPKSEAVLLNIPHYCTMFKSERIQKIFDHYDSIAEPGFSVKYLQQLIKSGDLPDPGPFNIRTICKD